MEKSIFDYNTIKHINKYWGDIRDYKNLKKTILETRS